jgi:phosphatidyl-myo-inositol dimannoside synthase
MKVILITQDFYPVVGGIATYLLQIYNEYFKKDDFSVIVPKKISKIEKYKSFDFPVHKLDFLPFSSFEERKKETQKILNLLIKEKPDLILFGYIRSHPEVAEMYTAINPNCKWGVILHAKEVYLNHCSNTNNNFKGSQKGYTPEEIINYTSVLKSSHFLISVSKFTKKLLKKQKIKNKVFVINPVLRLKSGIGKLKSIKFNSFNLLSVGRLIKRKGQDRVINAIDKLKSEIPEITYTLIGNGPEEKNLKRLTSEKGLNSKIKFLKKISDLQLAKYYLQSDVFVLPTRYIPPNDIEGFGIVFLEAGFYSKPVIGGKNGGVIEAIQNNKTGYLVNENDDKELITKIKYLYHHPRRRKLLGENGRKRILRNDSKNKKFVKFLKNNFINN